MAYTAGAAQVVVTPNLEGFHRTIGRKLQDEDVTFARAGTRWGRAAADGFKAGFDLKTVNALKPTVRPQVDDLKARAELDVLTRTRHAKVDVSVDRSALSRVKGLFGSLGGAGGGAGGLLGKLGGSGAGLFGSPAGLASAAVGVTALLPEVVSLASGFTAAGAGAGAFGALALPVFRKVSGAVQSINKDTASYDNALTAAARSTALKHLKQDWANLDPAQRKAVTGVQNLTTEYHRLAGSLQPQTLTVFNDGLSIAGHLLPKLSPFAKTFATSLDGMLKRFDKFSQSKGFQSFLNQLHAIEGPALKAIGDGLAKLGPDLGKLLTMFSAKDVANGITIAFDAVDLLLRGTAKLVDLTRRSWDAYTGSAHWAAGAVLAAAKVGILAAKGLTDNTLNAFHAITHGAVDAFGWVPGIGGKLKAADKAVQSWRTSVDKSFGDAKHSVDQWSYALNTAPKVARLTGNITDLTRKLATAKSQLKNPDLTKTRRAAIQADISQLQRQIAKAERTLAGLHGKTVYATVVEQVVTAQVGKTAASRLPHLLSQHGYGYASGTSSATRGWHLVGERGPEVEWFNGGEQVRPLGAGLRVPQLSVPAAPRIPRGGDGGGLVLRAVYQGPANGAVQAVMRDMRYIISAETGGDVQRSLGKGTARVR